MKLILTLLTCFLFANVYSQAEYEFYEKNKVQENFETYLEKFIEVFNGKNLSDLNEFINPELGIFILDNPGATTNAYNHKSLELILKSDREIDMYRLKNIVINCKPVKGKLPKYICDEWDREEGWDKEGCYYDNFNVSNFPYVNKYFDEKFNSGHDKNNEPNELYQNLKSELDKRKNMMKNVFYSTELIIGLYFGKLNGKYFLMMIDLSTPCDA